MKPNDFARCDGLLPKELRLPCGAPYRVWSIDCPSREICARYCAAMEDVESANAAPRPYVYAEHAPGEPCPHFIKEGAQ